MNISEAKNKIELVRNKLIEMQHISSFVHENIFDENETGDPLLPGTDMSEAYPERNAQMVACWEGVLENVPPGFAVDGNLIRHLSFNEMHDWFDITKRDIPRELVKIEEYQKHLYLIEYLDSLHSEVSRVSDIVLNGDLDAALKVVYSTLDSKIRSLLRVSNSQSTTSCIGKAFREQILVPPDTSNIEGVRNFLMGVIGHYRHWIIHNTLPQNRNRLEASLSLFALAHEAFILLDACSKHLVTVEEIPF